MDEPFAATARKLGVIVYYGHSSDAGVALVKQYRARGETAVTRDAFAFDGVQEPCNSVLVMSDVAPSLRARIEAAYPGRVRTATAPLPPAQVDPSLPAKPTPAAPPDLYELAQNVAEGPRRRGRPRKVDTSQDEEN